MAEIRFHGLRGQGVMTAAELLAIAASMEGRQAQVLPAFGTAREPGEIAVHCRLAEHGPDALVITDRVLLNHPSTLANREEDSYLLINSGYRVENLPPTRAITVPATELARKLTGHPTPTAALLGALAALTGVVLLDSVLTALRQWFGGSAGKAQATTALTTFGIVRTELEDLTAPATSAPQPTTH